jgi:hypothetical protein
VLMGMFFFSLNRTLIPCFFFSLIFTPPCGGTQRNFHVEINSWVFLGFGD